MNRVTIAEGIEWVGVNDRVTTLFERQWPLDKGMAYNSYLVLDERNALIDTVESSCGMDYVGRLREALTGKKLDYIVINHMEPDHAGAIEDVVRAFPGVTLIGNKKTREIFSRYFAELPCEFQEIADGETLSLGKHTLHFHFTPWVHWPETMMTFEEHTGVLFSADAFGSYGALDGAVTDAETEGALYEEEMLRYYSNIVGRYSKHVLKALDKLSGVPVKVVAPTHGLVWVKDPSWPIERFKRWAEQRGEEGVVVAVGSMYGATLTMAECLARYLVEEGVPRVVFHDVSKTPVSYILRDVWRYKGLCLGSVAYNTELFPPMSVLCDKIRHIGAANKKVGVFGGCSWSGGGVRNLLKFVEAQKGLTLVGEPVEMKGRLVTSVHDELCALAKSMASALREEA